jgi:hypothetical protein
VFGELAAYSLLVYEDLYTAIFFKQSTIEAPLPLRFFFNSRGHLSPFVAFRLAELAAQQASEPSNGVEEAESSAATGNVSAPVCYFDQWQNALMRDKCILK